MSQEEQPKVPYEDIPDSIKAAVDKSASISDADKEDAARFIYSEIQERGIAPDSPQAKSYIPVIVGVVGATLATVPRESQAFIGGFIQSLIKDAIEPILSLLESLQEGAMSMFDEFIKGSSESNATAQTASADAQNTVRARIHEQRLKAATAPTPQPCDSDAGASNAIQSDAKRSAQNETILFGLSSAGINTNPTILADDFKKQIERHGTSGKNLNVQSIIKETGIQNDEEEQAAADFLKNTIHIDTKGPTTEEIQRSLDQGFARVAYQQMAEKAKTTNRRQIAMLPLVDAKTSNDARRGPSHRATLRAEVERTYGSTSEGWRKEIRGYADPTPLLAELNINTAMNNYMLLRQLEIQQQGAMVDSVSVLEQIEKSGE